MLTVRRFMKSVMPLLKDKNGIQKGVVSFLTPYLSNCFYLTCYEGMESRGAAGERHRTRIVKFVLTKFVPLIVRNYCRLWTRQAKGEKPFLQNKPKSRKPLKYKKGQ